MRRIKAEAPATAENRALGRRKPTKKRRRRRRRRRRNTAKGRARTGRTHPTSTNKGTCNLQRVSLDRPCLQEAATAVTPKNGQFLGGKLMAVSLLPCDKLPECPKLEMKVVPEVPKKTAKIPACGLLQGPKVFPSPVCRAPSGFGTELDYALPSCFIVCQVLCCFGTVRLHGATHHAASLCTNRSFHAWSPV